MKCLTLRRGRGIGDLRFEIGDLRLEIGDLRFLPAGRQV